MSRRKFKSRDWPNDAFVELEVANDGSLEIEVATRYAGERRFDRITVTLSPKDAQALLQRLSRDLAVPTVGT